MRLVCPKCVAQYEVGEDAIPEAGRDVQCSACGHGWFQRHPAVAPPRTLVADLPPAPVAPPPAAEPPPRKPLDENVMAILREEALREAAARRADLARQSTQPPRPEPAPEAAPGRPPEATAIQPIPVRPVLPEPHRPVARRGLLPDIEEINSTLSAGSQQRGLTAPPPATRGPSFRTGFALMLSVMAIAAAAYVLAPRLAAAVPQGEAALTAYVARVDEGRRQLDAAVTAAQRRIEALLQPED